MNSSHHQLQVYDTGDTFSLDTAVRYEKNTDIESRSQAFHDALIALTTVAGKIPLGLLQRYGLDPLRTYQDAPDNEKGQALRDVMQRAVETEIRIRHCIQEGEAITQKEVIVTKNPADDTSHADAHRPYAIF